MQYIGFAPEEGALKGSRLQVKAIIHHISRVHITPATPHLAVVQYARAVALLLLGGTMCPDSSGNLVSLLYLAKLEDIVAARNYSWGSAVLTFLYRELCNASEKGKAAIGGALQLVHDSANNCPVIRDILDEMQYDQFIWQLYDMESNVIMAYAGDFNPQLWRSICPLIFYAIVEMHHPERVLRQFGMITYSTSLDGKDDMTRSYKDNPFPTEEIQIEDIGNVDVEGYRQLVAQLEHEVQIIAEAIKHQPQQTAIPSDSAPTTSHRQRRSSSQMSIGSVERGDIGVDIAGPSTAYTPQDYYVS
ncbi:UNVERIFIED_CONTAM: protein MAIN-LIKE 1 [Sesamum angustifolium]|uniref:Protein MAIN-LIKE 1 n=1 Tax=Sesamum angustifolium TaxID=2727405 RepID=A0AAW2NK65_9LAMI